MGNQGNIELREGLVTCYRTLYLFKEQVFYKDPQAHDKIDRHMGLYKDLFKILCIDEEEVCTRCPSPAPAGNLDEIPDDFHQSKRDMLNSFRNLLEDIKNIEDELQEWPYEFRYTLGEYRIALEETLRRNGLTAFSLHIGEKDATALKIWASEEKSVKPKDEDDTGRIAEIGIHETAFAFRDLVLRQPVVLYGDD